MSKDKRDTKINPDRDVIFAAHDLGYMDEPARLAWLLSFAQRSDLAQITGAALLRVQAEALVFATATNAVATDRMRLSARQLAMLSAEIREGIARFLDSRQWRANLRGHVRRRLYRDPSGTTREAIETTRQAMVLWVAQNLVRDNAGQIARCALPTCGRWFGKIKRQQFCSGACASKFRSLKWRANPKNRQKSRERRRDAYKVAQAKRQGRPISAVKIQKRGKPNETRSE
ncbi:MAG TPA: hypothetical protein VMV27_14300 [Candidatus Binataceae bacterium]|nr:hypothetical protein [Candidatus Binataceae bacterium]